MSLKGTVTTADYLPFSEYQRLVSSLEKDEDYRGAVYCILSFCLALRISDVLKLKWKDVLYCSGTIVTEKKTLKTKMIPIGKRTSEHLDKLYNNIGKPSLEHYIVINAKDGSPISRQYMNRLMKTWKDKYELKLGNFSSHTFRKTFGRYVYEKMGKTQESLVFLNRIFRHTNLQTTMIYIGLRDDEIGNIFNSIDI